jgi:two-component system, NarL family, nitrate/nitrite response regulator NarL
VTLRCVIVDDSPEVLRAASELLEGEGVAVVGVAETGEEAIRLMDELQPDVMLVDVDLGPESGLDLARRIAPARDSARPRTILISTYDEADFGKLIADSPAIGFLPKSDLSATAIRRLVDRAGGEGAIEPAGT